MARTAKTKAKTKSLPAPKVVTAADPLNINGRLYYQIGALLSALEQADEDHITLRERIQALVAIGRIQTIFVGLRKEKIGDDSAGSAVRKYAVAFQDDAGRGKKGRRTDTTESERDDWFEHAAIDSDDDDAA